MTDSLTQVNREAWLMNIILGREGTDPFAATRADICRETGIFCDAEHVVLNSFNGGIYSTEAS